MVLGAWPHEQLIPCVRILLRPGDSEEGLLISPALANTASQRVGYSIRHVA